MTVEPTISDQYVGEIRMFAADYAPKGWMLCDGRILMSTEHPVLFSLIGKTYGGNGVTTFALPDFRGRVAVGAGAGVGLTVRTAGDVGGTETVTLSVSNMPPHIHEFRATKADATKNTPVGGLFAKVVETTQPQVIAGYSKQATSSALVLNVAALQPAFGNGVSAVAHENMMPVLAINYIIATEGLYPAAA